MIYVVVIIVVLCFAAIGVVLARLRMPPAPPPELDKPALDKTPPPAPPETPAGEAVESQPNSPTAATPPKISADKAEWLQTEEGGAEETPPPTSEEKAVDGAREIPLSEQDSPSTHLPESAESDKPALDEVSPPDTAETFADKAEVLQAEENGTEETASPPPENDVPPASPTEKAAEDSGAIAPPPVLPPAPPAPPKSQETKNPGDGVARPRTPRPPKLKKYKLTCRKAGGEWNIFVHLLPPGRQGGFAATFRQSGAPLEFDRSECKLSDYSSPITCEDGEVNAAVAGNPPYIFRFGKDWQGEGRKAGKVFQKGHYIVIAPRQRERVNSSPPVAPEDCADKNFLAHFFPADGGGADGLAGYAPFICAGFSLAGETVYDNKPDDLFFGSPELAGDLPAWIAIDKINGKTAKNIGGVFAPAKKTIADAIGGATGVFSVRFHDGQKWQEGVPFRVTSSLNKILINEEPYSRDSLLFPAAAGHRTVKVRFVGKGGGALDAELKGENKYIKKRGKGVFDISPHPVQDFPGGDSAQWVLKEESDVEIDITLPTVWWRWCSKKEDKENFGWRETPPELSREEFRALEDDLEISVPAGVPHLMVGVKGERGMKIPARRDPAKFGRSLVTVKKIDIMGYVRDSSEITELQVSHEEETLVFLVIQPEADAASDQPPESGEAATGESDGGDES